MLPASKNPDDKEKFAFSVLTLNNHQPLQRYQWTYLPQGMMNSPTICQGFDDLTLWPLSQQYPTANIYHWRRKWQPTPVFLPGESQGQGSLVGCRLWGRTESDTTEAT